MVLIVLSAFFQARGESKLKQIATNYEDYGKVINNFIIATILYSIIIFIITSFLLIYEYESKLKPIDAYRNNTELKVNGYYQNDVFVVTDSIVVFKK